MGKTLKNSFVPRVSAALLLMVTFSAFGQTAYRVPYSRLDVQSASEQKVFKAPSSGISLGPILSDVFSDTASIWIRTQAEAACSVVYSTSPDLAGSVVSGIFKSSENADFTLTFRLIGLLPSTRYYYNVIIGEGFAFQAPYPNFETAPSDDTPVAFKFGLITDQASIAKFPASSAPAFCALASNDPVMVLQLGDYDHRFKDGSLVTLDLIRAMHRDLRSPETVAGLDFITCLQSLPLYHTYDDHDWCWQWGDIVRTGTVYSPYSALVLQAFGEYYPQRLASPAYACFKNFRYAQCEFIMLDCRALRARQDDPDGPAKSMLAGLPGPVDQKTWLKEVLLNSTATWKFITCGVVWNSTCSRGGTWYSYPDERREIVDFVMENRIRNVVVLSGDFHSGGAIDSGVNADFPEMLVPNTNLNKADGPSPRGRWDIGFLAIEDVAPFGNGFSLVTVDTNPDRVTLETRGVENEVRLQLTVLAR